MAARLAIETPGAEPAFVFLHYFGGAGRAWASVVDRLDGRRCLALDLPGFGASPPLPVATVAGMADAVEAAVADAAPGRYVLVGHSMGGKIAVALAGRRPAGLAGLVLVAPSPPTPEPMAEPDRGAALRAWGNRQAADETVRRVAGRFLPFDVAAIQIADHLRVARVTWAWWLQGGSREVVLEAARRVAVPTLVIGGGADQVMGLSVIDGVTGSIPGARRVMLPGCGHLIPLEAPDLLASMLIGFKPSLG